MDVLQCSEWHLEMYKLTIWILKITKYNYSSSLPVEDTNHIFKQPCQAVLCFFFVVQVQLKASRRDTKRSIYNQRKIIVFPKTDRFLTEESKTFSGLQLEEKCPFVYRLSQRFMESPHQLLTLKSKPREGSSDKTGRSLHLEVTGQQWSYGT